MERRKEGRFKRLRRVEGRKEERKEGKETGPRHMFGEGREGRKAGRKGRK